MKTDNKYNGWTNYATWRVALENFDGVSIQESGLDSAEACQAYVEEYLEMQNENSTTLSYALAFLQDVNWYEIFESLED